MSTRATYVYCIVRSTRQPSAARLPPGLPGASPPEVLPVARDLWLVSASVPLDRYGPGALEPALRDLDRVGRVAFAHDAVVEHVARSRGTTVIPMKLFTMFSTPEKAAAEARRRVRRLAGVFRHIEGCEEWGVRVVRGPSRREPRRRANPTTGAAFLAARKAARDEAAAAARSLVDAADATFASLRALSRDQWRRRDAAAGRAPLLDAAFLVPMADRGSFRATARRLARQVARSGGSMTLTGPWPPYNFVSREGGA